MSEQESELVFVQKKRKWMGIGVMDCLANGNEMNYFAKETGKELLVQIPIFYTYFIVLFAFFST